MTSKALFYQYDDLVAKADPVANEITVKERGQEPRVLPPHTKLGADIVTQGKAITEQEYDAA